MLSQASSEVQCNAGLCSGEYHLKLSQLLKQQTLQSTKL